MVQKYLCGAAYALGENRRHYSEIPAFEDLAKEKRLPLHNEVIGLGAFFVTTDVYGLAQTCVSETLCSAAIDPAEIDHVILCSSYFKEQFLDRNREIGRLLTGARVAPKAMRVLCGSGCADMLSSIDLACTMVESSKARNVLAVCLESCPSSDQSRVQGYGILSDAAASVVVSEQLKPGALEIAASGMASSVSAIGAGMTIRTLSPNRAFVQNVLSGAQRTIAGVTKVFGNNVFVPIKAGREGALGFSRHQLYLENVPKKGHCLGCDCIINLVDFKNGQPEAQYVLYAEAEGHIGCVVLSHSATT